MPLSCRSKVRGAASQKGGYLPLAPGVSSVRYPIRQRTFKYVATVKSETDETCQEPTLTGPPPNRRKSTLRSHCWPRRRIVVSARNRTFVTEFLHTRIATLRQLAKELLCPLKISGPKPSGEAVIHRR